MAMASAPAPTPIGHLRGRGHSQDLAVIAGGSSNHNADNLSLFLNNNGTAFMPTYTGDHLPNHLDMMVGEQFSDTLTLITNTTTSPGQW